LVGRKLALVDDRPGVTRDRREGEAPARPRIPVIDTAGYEDEDPDTLPGRMRAQTDGGVREAMRPLFLIDARAGVTPLDEEIGALAEEREDTRHPCRQQGRRAGAARAACWKPMRWAFGEPIALSAEHGEGVVDLFEHLRPYVEREESEEEEEGEADPTLKLAIVGRPNAGKSTLINKMLQQDRLITGPGGGDHTRFDRDRLAMEGPSRPADRHRRNAEEGERSTTSSKSFRSPMRGARWTSPKWSCSSSMARAAWSRRTFASPTTSFRKDAR
jgi:GTP-binding protein